MRRFYQWNGNRSEYNKKIFTTNKQKQAKLLEFTLLHRNMKYGSIHFLLTLTKLLE